ncbi:FecR family protein [Neorhizobium sp. JUb45]|uniref:FecR family protein n=1 Tax=unclassified Neorhizobium TaxID=2629175 RepID=UPI0014048392|nr:FecR family protein [Neorhizobium sp. JUb45]
MSDDKANDRKLREQAVDWLLRLQDEPDDPMLQAQFQTWLAKDPARAVVYERARRAMGDASHLLKSDLDFAQKAAHKPLLRARNVVAALLVIMAGSGAFMAADGPMRLRADIITGTGQPQHLTLADGSRVELNAETAIAIHMERNERRIKLLRGQAYFEVAADPARPFVVEAGHGSTTALGTAFDINLTADATHVTVTEHAVMVTSLSGDGRQRLPEGNQLSYDDDGQLGAVEPADIGMATAWRQGRIVFENRPLAAVVDEIARYLPGRIVIAQSDLATRKISGSLDLTDPQTALDGFSEAIGIKVTRLGPYLTILRQ